MRPTTFLKIASTACLAALLASCSATSVSLDYRPELSQAVAGPRKIAAGRFADLRRENEYYIGSVRTPVGTPMETITSRVPVSEVVRNAFAHGLSIRNMLVSQSSAPYVLTGEILELQCDQVVRPAAYVKVRVNVVRASSGQVVFSRIYQGERQSGAYVPMTGSPVPELRELTSRALQDTVDRALDDAALRARLTSGTGSYGPPGSNVL
jgi:ABC-type uncharacterized transport system auxiliary subunit